jgi:hypothetical protein
MMDNMHRQRRSALLFAVFCALAGLAPEAQAYLDPSTGSMILSAIVGLFATIGLALKTYWYKLRNLLVRRPDASPSERDASDGTPPRAATDSRSSESGRDHQPS